MHVPLSGLLLLVGAVRARRLSAPNPKPHTAHDAKSQVETFPDKHESVEDFLETLKYAFLYAKTVTLGPTHWPKTNAVMLRNRRIGCSMSGLAQVTTLLWWWCRIASKAKRSEGSHEPTKSTSMTPLLFP